MQTQEFETTLDGLLKSQFSYERLVGFVISLEPEDKNRLEIECRKKTTNLESLWLGGALASTEGNFVEAVERFCRLLEMEPKQPVALVGLGIAMSNLGQSDAGAECYSEAILADPHCVEAYFYRGNHRFEQGRFDEAIADYSSAITLAPEFLQAHNNMGMALTRMGQHTQSLAILEKAVSLGPSQPAAHCNLGVAFFNCNEFEKALASYERALTINPAYAEVHNNRANALMELGRTQEAIESYDCAIAHKPEYVEATWNKALALLTIGDFAQGWRLHECRWDRPAFAPIKRQFRQPVWLGEESLVGKSILLHCEQGMGDAIQFCRYAPLVKALGATVILEVHPALMGLMASLAGVDTIVRKGDTLPKFDFHCPLMSLPLAMGTELSTVPAPSAYLMPNPDRIAKWRSRIGEQPSTGLIGLVCSGDPLHRNDHNRTIPLTEMLTHLPKGLQYVILQRDIRESDRAVIHAHPHILSFEGQISDFADTAALCCLVDQVISVDTSVAHLSAALGKRTHILLPICSDWRWLRVREDSPWYPSARLYRQTAVGQWASVIDGVGKVILDAQKNRAANLQPY